MKGKRVKERIKQKRQNQPDSTRTTRLPPLGTYPNKENLVPKDSKATKVKHLKNKNKNITGKVAGNGPWGAETGHLKMT